MNLRDTIRGKRRVISTSKIRKIMAIRKKCRENGSRAEALGSNPHSNGDLFSRSRNDFFEVKFRITIRSVLMKIMIRANKIKI